MAARVSKIIKLACTNVTAVAAAASVVVPRNCFIVAIKWAQHVTGDAAGEGVCVELSLSQTSQHTVSDAASVISQSSCVANAIGSNSENHQETGICFPIRAGERLNLNVAVVGTPTVNVTGCFIHIVE